MFPLETALLPGEELPLRIFEPRYVALVGDCMAMTEPAFGVVLIAVFLDRVTASLGSLGEHPASLLGMLRRRRTARRLAAASVLGADRAPETSAEEKELQNA